MNLSLEKGETEGGYRKVFDVLVQGRPTKVHRDEKPVSLRCQRHQYVRVISLASDHENTRPLHCC